MAGPQGTGVDPLPPAPQPVQQRSGGHGTSNTSAAPASTPSAATAPARPVAHGNVPTIDPFREPSLSLLRFDHRETVQVQYATPSGHVVMDSMADAEPEQDIENDSIDELTRKQPITTIQVGNPATGQLIARVAHYKPIKSRFTVSGPAGEVLLIGKQVNALGLAPVRVRRRPRQPGGHDSGRPRPGLRPWRCLTMVSAILRELSFSVL